MKTHLYEIMLRTGRTETVEAEGFITEGTSLLFYDEDGNFLALPHDRYLLVERVDDSN